MNESLGPSDWITQAEEALSSLSTNRFTSLDIGGTSIILEWEVIHPELESFTHTMNGLAETLIEAYLPVELQFCKRFSGALAKDWLLNSLAPFFEQEGGMLNWNEAEECIRQILLSFFTDQLAINLRTEDVYILVTAKEANTDKVLGIIFFSITPQSQYGTVRVPLFGILPIAQKRGLGKLLMSSIFTLIPFVRVIGLSTRITNENALSMYQAIGFTETKSTVENWVNLEYVTAHSAILQKQAMVIH